MTIGLASAEEVHRFWFADTLDDPQAASTRSRVWFGTDARFDDQIRSRFEPTIRAAASGELRAWEDAPRTCICLVVVLDQFPRNAYRNTAAAFDHDAVALSAARHGVAAGYLDALSAVERPFLLMPYQHAEDVATQRESVRLFERVLAQAPGEWRSHAEINLQFARAHLEIVERFGRFPHRNAVLARASTPMEREYLDSKPQTFGQGA
jgi:uncharacterized protein (DUF924 family)